MKMIQVVYWGGPLDGTREVREDVGRITVRLPLSPPMQTLWTEAEPSTPVEVYVNHLEYRITDELDQEGCTVLRYVAARRG